MKKFVILMGVMLVLAFVALPASVIRGDDLNNPLYSQEVEIQQLDDWTINDECTIGVNHSSTTTHDSPVLWKVRDLSLRALLDNPEVCQAVQHYSKDELPYDFIAIVHWDDDIEESRFVGMGLNEAAVGVGNSWVNPYNYDEHSNREYMYHILGNYGHLEEIRNYIEFGDGKASGCFPFIDNFGNASMFEVDASQAAFWEYNTMDAARESQGLLGFVVRANEFHQQDDGMDDTSILGRYLAGTENTLGLITAGEYNEQSVVQSDSDEEYRLIRASDRPAAISNNTSRSAMAIRGAAQGEDPALATMWALLGNPSFSIAVPAWVAVSDVPEYISTCAMYEAVTALYNDQKMKEERVQAAVFPAEAHLFNMVNNRILPHWRTLGGPPAVEEMGRIEHQMAEDAYSVVNYLATTGDQNLAPTIDFEATHVVSMQYGFTAITGDADGSVVSYLWNFGDDTTSTEAAPEHEFPAPGVYLVSITIADDDGVTTTAWRYLTVPTD